MVPSQHIETPGKSPFMDMQLVPKFADEAKGEAGIAIDPTRTQSLGLRVVEARTGRLGGALTATGAVAFNQRDNAIVPERASGSVSRVYALATDGSGGVRCRARRGTNEWHQVGT